MVLPFPIMADYGLMTAGKRLCYFTHGHIYNLDRLPPLRKGDILLHGHTHVPVIFEKTPTGIETTSPADAPIKAALGHRLFVNVGSVGQPRDGDWRSSYVIYNTQERTLAFRRVEYDVDTAVDRNRKAGLPERLCTRLLEGH
jgi:diadenosine tetraphosphatase ApaH/serine/threonine PP2A family protein phosphatase